MTLPAGTRLGPYELLAPVGAGGMGEVYRALDTRLERTVAVKVLPPHLSSAPESRQRFEREAKTISQLSHPHICALYDVGREGETEYLVMEYLEGETLSERLLKGALPFDQVIRYGIEIADALDKAHRQGIVHRDLKPGNVMLTKSGVKLLDFGLAKAIAPTSSPAQLTSFPTQAALTQEGTILGTFQYMAPEQLEGKEADARTDIFAFGVVLHEMATGQKAFSGKTQASLIAAIIEREPPLISSLAPMTPPAFDQVVRTCLAKDPEERWQSARDIEFQLRMIGARSAEDSSRSTAGSRARNRERVGSALALLVAALVAYGVGRLHSRPIEMRRPVRFTFSPPEGTTFGSTIVSGAVALSPDGTRLAFITATPGGRSRLWVRDLDSLAARGIAGTEGAELPFWSPDGRSLAFFADRKLKKIDLADGVPRTLAEAPGGRGGTWNPDGTIIFSPSGSSLKSVSNEGGAAADETERSPEESHRWPQFLPDGRHYLFLVFSEKRENTGIYVASRGGRGRDRKRLVNAASNVMYAPPGYLLYVRDRTLMAHRFDANRLELSGDPYSIADVGRFGEEGPATYAPFTVSNNGVLAYGRVVDFKARLVWFDRRGSVLDTIGPEAFYADLYLSPDGSQVVTTRVDAEIGTPDLWLVDARRGVLSRFTDHPGWEVYPLWSPDGTRIVFSSDRAGRGYLYSKRLSGGDEEEPLFRGDTDVWPSDWSPDGQMIVCELYSPKTKLDLWVLPLAEGKPRPLLQTAFNEGQARISSDGRYIAYISDESGQDEVYVQTFPLLGSKWRVSIDGGNDPAWRRDDKELFYLSGDGKLMSADVKLGPGFQTSIPRPLFQTRTPSNSVAGFRSLYVPSVDGQRFLVVNQTESVAASSVTVVLDWISGLKR